MRVIKKSLGGGLYRLEPVPTFCCERIKDIPQHVMDDIMKDVILRDNGCCNVKNTCSFNSFQPNRFNNDVTLEPRKRSYAELRNLERFGEPDGIDIHVDRPLKENFCCHSEWARAMAKYRTLEDVAKDCDWECREPMKGTDFYRSCPTPSNAWVDEDWDDEDINWCDNDDDADWDDWSCSKGWY